MTEMVYKIVAEWDSEAEVWVAHSPDVPGLATGSDTIEGLLEKLRVVVPELLQENGLLPGPGDAFDFPISIIAQRLERLRLKDAA